jgi:hypothetical protein
MTTKIFYGWVYNATRNDDKKQHPNLTKFKKLDKDTKDYDYQQIMELKEVWEV